MDTACWRPRPIKLKTTRVIENRVVAIWTFLDTSRRPLQLGGAAMWRHGKRNTASRATVCPERIHSTNKLHCSFDFRQQRHEKDHVTPRHVSGERRQSRNMAKPCFSGYCEARIVITVNTLVVYCDGPSTVSLNQRGAQVDGLAHFIEIGE